MARPMRAGELADTGGRKRGDAYRLPYDTGGVGVPPGPPMRANEFTLYPREWYRTNFFDRPVVVIPDGCYSGRIQWIFCGSVPTGIYTPFSTAANFDADSARYGQPIFLHRPAEWDFYLDSDPKTTEPVRCRVVDAAFFHVDKPQLHHLVGFDPTLNDYRTIGGTPDDPAGMWTSNHGGAVLFDGQPVHAAAFGVNAGSQLCLAANPARKGALFINDDDTAPPAAIRHYLGLGVAAVVAQGIRLNSAGGSYQVDGDEPFLGDVYVIGSAAGPSNLLVTEW